MNSFQLKKNTVGNSKMRYIVNADMHLKWEAKKDVSYCFLGIYFHRHIFLKCLVILENKYKSYNEFQFSISSFYLCPEKAIVSNTGRHSQWMLRKVGEGLMRNKILEWNWNISHKIPIQIKGEK